MDVIVDTIGDYDNYTSFYDVLLSGGRFVRLNTTSSGKKFVPVLLGMQGDGGELFSLLKDYKGSHINKVAVDYDIFDSFEEEKELFTEDLAYLFQLLQSGKIKGRVFSDIGIGFGMLEEKWMKVMTGATNGDGVLVVSPFQEECNEAGSTEQLISNIIIHYLDDDVEMYVLR